MILLVASQKDIAGMNIAKHILNQLPLKETNQTFQENPTCAAEINNKKITYITLREEAVNAQNLPEYFNDLDLVVFISRHSSASGTPTLSVHTPGNFSSAELGGLPKKLSVSPAFAMQIALRALAHFREEMRLNYEVSYECTHHGPSLDVPTMFVELGSSPLQWNDNTAAQAVAKATIEAIIKSASPKQEHTAVVGIGGTHYNQRFTRIALEGKLLFGHMIPKYAISCIDAEILSQCIEKTLEKVSSVVLDWKGIKSEDKPRLLRFLSEISLPVTKI